MLKRNFFPRLEIPGLGFKTKPNSKDVSVEKTKEFLQDTVAYLIAELTGKEFELATSVTDEGIFSVKISKLQSQSIPSYRMSIDVEVFRWIYDGLYLVLSNNKIFHGLGSVYGTFKIPTWEVPTWNALDIAIAINEEEVYFDFARMDLHNFLYNVCLSFILRHEIRHIANGHVGYILNENRPFFFENSHNGLSPLDSQTLEMDVDSCVFAGLLDGFLNDDQHLSQMPEELRDDRGKLVTCLFCIQFLFYCLPSRKVEDRADASKGSHPNAYLRYFFCFTSGLSLLQEKYPTLFNEFGELHENNFFPFFDNLAEIGAVNLDSIIADHSWTVSSDGQEYAEEIWNNWNNWYPKLEPHCYLKLAPPSGSK